MSAWNYCWMAFGGGIAWLFASMVFLAPDCYVLLAMSGLHFVCSRCYAWCAMHEETPTDAT